MKRRHLTLVRDPESPRVSQAETIEERARRARTIDIVERDEVHARVRNAINDHHVRA